MSSVHDQQYRPANTSSLQDSLSGNSIQLSCSTIEAMEKSKENEDIENSSIPDIYTEEEQDPAEGTLQQLEKDPNLVEWDGPKDPGNPMNWSFGKKWAVTISMGCMTFCITFASSVFSTATVPVSELYHLSTEMATLGTSWFVLGFGLGPLVSFCNICVKETL